MDPFAPARAAIRCRARFSLTSILMLLVAGTLALMVARPGIAQTPGANEFQIEAVFLFNFSQFVVWPPTAFADENDPFVICLLGTDPFGAYLDDTVRDETVNRRRLLVKRYRRAEEVDNCHILFISKSEAGRLSEALVRLQGRSVLSVSDADNFGRRGGMVRFVVERNHVRLRVNVEAAKKAGLTISSKLLRVVDIVETGGE